MFRGKRLFWQLYFSYLIITVLSLAVVSWFALSFFTSFYRNQLTNELKSEISTLKELIKDKFSPDYGKELDAICKKYGEITTTRLTIILPDGTVLGDTDEDPKKMDDHSDRPEVKSALTTGRGYSERYSFTERKNMFYVASLVTVNSEIKGIVRASLPVKSINEILNPIYFKIIGAGIVVAFLIAVIILLVSNLLSKPLEKLKDGVIKFADGDFKHRISTKASFELVALADAINRMAEELNQRIQTITKQKNELEAVLKSMVEAVIVIDNNERVIKCNETAGILFGIDPKNAQDKTIQEAIRNTKLHQFIKRTLSSSVATEEEISTLEPEEKFLQATGVTIKDNEGNPVGALVVLNDITRLKKLETMRKDFVSNVSHELKTPITSIKGFVETLRDGAINDKESSKKFLEIIATHSERLNAIIEDLLSLSRIEQNEGKEKLSIEDITVKNLLSSAVSVCEGIAIEKGIKINLSCDPKLKAKLNGPFLEHAITNLLDNAVKYSEPGKTVDLTAIKTDKDLVITVTDQGFGIPKEHLERIFERFYRVDKARSRKMGGTGLGLAIVKHVIQAHCGTIDVESTLGKGSIFTIRLPQD